MPPMQQNDSHTQDAINAPAPKDARRSPAPEDAHHSSTSEDARRSPAPKAADEPTSITKQLLLLAIPTFGQLVAEPVFVLIDTAIIGHVSDASLAGLSLGSTVLLTAVGLCVFLAYSTTSQVAHLFGAGKRQEGFQAGFNSIWLSLCIGIALLLVLFLGAQPICAALGGRGDVLEQATIYTRMVALGVPGMLLVYAANGIFRGLQKVSITLVAAVSGAALNAVLAVLFVIVCGWGIAGSGLATCIAQWFMGLSLLAVAIAQAKREGASIRPHMSGIASAGGDGFPLFLRTLFLRIAMVATVMAATAMGDDVLAGYQIVYASWSFALNILDAAAIAGQTLVGAELGARRFNRARTLTQATARFGLWMGVIVGVCFAVIGLVAGQVFSPNPHIQSLAAVGMLVVGITFPLQGWMWALDGILIGAGDFRYLSATMAMVAVAHVAALVLLVFAIAPHLPGDAACTAALWATFGAVLMGGRGIANGLRARSDVWMKVS